MDNRELVDADVIYIGVLGFVDTRGTVIKRNSIECRSGSPGPTAAFLPLGHGVSAASRIKATVWLTGLPSAGKTTLAQALLVRLCSVVQVEHIDGDVFRAELFGELGFSAVDRRENTRRIGYLAEIVARQGTLVIVSSIAPYRSARHAVRESHKDAGITFLEVYLDTPISVCEGRDVKGLFAKHRRGEVSGVTGLDDPYEVPAAPDLVLNTHRLSVDECVAKIVATLRRIDCIAEQVIRLHDIDTNALASSRISTGADHPISGMP